MSWKLEAYHPQRKHRIRMSVSNIVLRLPHCSLLSDAVIYTPYFLAHVSYGCDAGGQTQDFTKTFASSQTGNKAPPTGSSCFLTWKLF